MQERRENASVEPTKTAVRQGTGPREMVTVLTVSIALAVVVGALVLVWFYAFPQQPRV